MSGKKAILVVGAGDASGGAIARRFAREGYIACVTRRHADKLAPLVARIEAAGGAAHAFGSDARKEDEESLTAGAEVEDTLAHAVEFPIPVITRKIRSAGPHQARPAGLPVPG